MSEQDSARIKMIATNLSIYVRLLFFGYVVLICDEFMMYSMAPTAFDHHVFVFAQNHVGIIRVVEHGYRRQLDGRARWLRYLREVLTCLELGQL